MRHTHQQLHLFLVQDATVTAVPAAGSLAPAPPNDALMTIKFALNPISPSLVEEFIRDAVELFRTTLAVYCLHVNADVSSGDIEKRVRDAVQPHLPIALAA